MFISHARICGETSIWPTSANGVHKSSLNKLHWISSMNFVKVTKISKSPFLKILNKFFLLFSFKCCGFCPMISISKSGIACDDSVVPSTDLVEWRSLRDDLFKKFPLSIQQFESIPIRFFSTFRNADFLCQFRSHVVSVLPVTRCVLDRPSWQTFGNLPIFLCLVLAFPASFPFSLGERGGDGSDTTPTHFQMGLVGGGHFPSSVTQNTQFVSSCFPSPPNCSTNSRFRGPFVLEKIQFWILIP